MSIRPTTLVLFSILASTLAEVVSADDRVPEDVARAALETVISAATTSVVLCIEVNGADPTDKLLDELSMPSRRVIRSSACTRALGAADGSYETATGKPAHFLSVSNMKWLTESSIEAEAEEYYHGKWARRWTIRLIRGDAGWKVSTFHLDAEA